MSVGTIMRTLLSVAMLYRKASRGKRAFAMSQAGPMRGCCKGRSEKRCKKCCEKCGARKHRGPCAAKSPVRALGAMSVGATALGALAVGALAIGALAIKRLAIKRGEVERLDIRELKVKRLEVDELLIREETRSQPQPQAGEQPPPAPSAFE